MPKILIVDDEPHIRRLLEETLEDFEDLGVEILTAVNGLQAVNIITQLPPPEGGGLDLRLEVA